MSVGRYRGRHLRPQPRGRHAAAVGAATAVWVAGSSSAAAARHQVASGETLSSIAARYGTTVAALSRANQLADPNLIVAGTTLRIPGGSPRSSPAQPSAPATGRHEVASGETLSSIAARYGTTVAALSRANQLADPNLIVAGTTLRVPGEASAGAQGAPARTGRHEVASGETLSSIAARYGTTVAALSRLNHLSNPSLIVAGASLRVPLPDRSSSAGSLQAASQATIEVHLERAATRHGVDPSLVKAVAWQESGWQQDIKSETGALGVMQVMPATARYVNGVLGAGDLDVRAASGNVELGVIYLRHLLSAMGSEKRALAGYYSGPGAVKRKLDKHQKRYVNSVLALRSRFS